MFNKAAVFTDLHQGLKGNSAQHNSDCEDFVDWFIQVAKENGCETGIFCGDWNHNRNTLNITTMDSGIRNLEKLGAAFDQFYIFPGNHDLYYRDKRDIKSTEFAKHIPGITVVDEITTIDDVTLVPWLVGNEWKQMQNLTSKYVFGHFELPSFFMNARVRMPDSGELRSETFVNQKYVFSGHFHKRQISDNIHYIGNAFPHNYADSWDDERGMMILDRQNDAEPEYIDWPECPKYRTIKLSKLIDEKDSIMKSNMHLRVELDCELTFEEACYVKETFMKHYDCREITLIPMQKFQDYDSDVDITQFVGVDSIVQTEITQLDTRDYDKTVLLELYKGLE